MVDLTTTVQKETEQICREAVEAANVHLGVIEQAKGILMGASKAGADEAFRMLIAGSNRSNVKLALLAQRITETASTAGAAEAVEVLHAGPPDSGGPYGILFRRGG